MKNVLQRTLPLLLALAVGAASCGDDSGPIADVEPPPRDWTDCQASTQSFVRKAILAVQGRRAWGQAEVRAYADYYEAVEAAGSDPKEAVIRALAESGEYRERWGDFFMDALLVDRLSVIEENYLQFKTEACFREPSAQPIDSGQLAEWVRDNYPSASGPPVPEFDMGHLLSSALELDDLSPVYRANLFALLRFPLPAPNVSPDERERARRFDFGTAFESAYIRRDPTCVVCHNSAASVTYSEDPTLNRHWALPGLFEEALYGTSAGPGDALVPRSIMRYVDVANEESGRAPYGWNGRVCGKYAVPSQPDPLGIEVHFASIRSTPDNPQLGARASVWALDPALRQGVEALATEGLAMDGEGHIANPDAAFAYLVGASIVQSVWTEIMGSDLTTVTQFPRSEIQRDILKELTDAFVASRFSLKRLLVDIARHPAFNLTAPDAGCGESDAFPTVFDPWTTVVDAEGRRVNSAADGVFPITSRTLGRSLHRAMGWPKPAAFPEDDELALQSALGYYIRRSQPSVRGLTFEGRLAWEQHYGRCENRSSEPDYVDELADLAATTPGVALEDAIIALKDRLLNEPYVTDSERPLLEAILGRPLSDTAVAEWRPVIRTACGAILQAPQLFLAGLAQLDTEAVPVLGSPSHDYLASCEQIRAAVATAGDGHSISCGDQLQLTPR